MGVKEYKGKKEGQASTWALSVVFEAKAKVRVASPSRLSTHHDWPRSNTLCPSYRQGPCDRRPGDRDYYAIVALVAQSGPSTSSTWPAAVLDSTTLL